jgi:hypothetical protein
MPKAAKLDLQKPLPRLLVIPKVMTLKTLDDVRSLIEKHLPPETRAKSTWQHVEKELTAAASGGDPVQVYAALQMVLMLEGVEIHPKGKR